MKRLFFIVPLLCGLSGVHASDEAASKGIPSGFVFGLDGQGTNGHMEIDQNVSIGNDMGNPDTLFAPGKAVLAHSGMGGRAFLGYHYVSPSCSFMGLEAGYGLSGFKKSSEIYYGTTIPENNLKNTLQTKRPYSIDVALKVGGLVGKTALYLKTGAQWTRWSLKNTFEDPEAVETEEIKRYVPSWIIGGGALFNLGKVQFKAEAGFNLYTNKKLILAQTGTDVDYNAINIATNGKIKPEMFLNLGLVYTLPVK